MYLYIKEKQKTQGEKGCLYDEIGQGRSKVNIKHFICTAQFKTITIFSVLTE